MYVCDMFINVIWFDVCNTFKFTWPCNKNCNKNCRTNDSTIFYEKIFTSAKQKRCEFFWVLTKYLCLNQKSKRRTMVVLLILFSKKFGRGEGIPRFGNCVPQLKNARNEEARKFVKIKWKDNSYQADVSVETFLDVLPVELDASGSDPQKDNPG
jgi:hypothetical protein